jgi:hypothetical protein
MPNNTNDKGFKGKTTTKNYTYLFHYVFHQQWVEILKSTMVEIDISPVVIVRKWVVWKQFHPKTCSIVVQTWSIDPWSFKLQVKILSMNIKNNSKFYGNFKKQKIFCQHAPYSTKFQWHANAMQFSRNFH